MAQSAPHVFRGAMPRASAPDLEELALIDDDEEEQGAIGAVASIQAAARKGTRPRIVKFVFVVYATRPRIGRDGRGERRRVAPARYLSDERVARLDAARRDGGSVRARAPREAARLASNPV